MALIDKLDAAIVQRLSGTAGSGGGAVQLSTVNSKVQSSSAAPDYGAVLSKLRNAFYNSYARTSNAAVKFQLARDAVVKLLDITDRMVKVSEQATDIQVDDPRRETLQSQFVTLVRDFNDVLKRTKSEGVDLLDKDQLEKVLKVSGIDLTKVSRLAELFRQVAGRDGQIGFEKVAGEDVVLVGEGTSASVSVTRWVNESYTARATTWTYTPPPLAAAPDLVESSDTSGATVESSGTGDIDGDGNLDVLRKLSTGDLVISLGNGDGSFGSAQTAMPLGAEQISVLVDLNSDGNDDLVATSGELYFSNGDGSFAAPFTIAADWNAQAGFGDLNEDGHLDFVVGTSAGVRFGNGDGSFSDTIALAAGLRGAVVGDFNGDSNLDIAWSGETAGSTDMLLSLGNGDGTFAAAASIGSSAYLSRMVSADINGDGFLDLVSGNDPISSVFVQLGNGDGSFRSAVTTITGDGSFPSSGFGLADRNSDGVLDLVIQSPEGTSDLYVLTGNANGSFKAAVTLGPPVSATVVAADFNGDGRLDTLGVGPSLAVYLSAGEAQSAPFSTVNSSSAAAFGSLVTETFGDFNNDGKVDVVRSFTNGPYIDALSLGNGDGSFGPAVTLAVGSTGVAIGAADLDNDGNVDLIAGRAVAGTSMVRFGNGDGTFADAQTRAFEPLSYADVDMNPVFTDLNGDGAVDFIGRQSGIGAELYINNGDGTFQVAQTFTQLDGLNVAGLGDFNGDDNVDVIMNTSGGTSIAFGNGDGSFEAPSAVDAPFTTTDRLHWADFDGDSDLDLVYLDGSAGQLRLGVGDGTFQAAVPLDLDPFAALGDPIDIAVIDIDQDGAVDIVTTQDLGGGLRDTQLHRGRGDASFAAPTTLAASGSLLRVLDVTQDGNEDLLVAMGDGSIRAHVPGDPSAGTWTSSTASSVVHWYHEAVQPTGTFAAAASVELGSAGANYSTVKFADFNGDAKDDMLAFDFNSSSVELLLGNGDGTFKSASTVADNSTGNIATADIDGDGFVDFVEKGDAYLRMFVGNADGTFKAPVSYATGVSAGFAVTDVENDGVSEVFAGGNLFYLNGSGRADWFLGEADRVSFGNFSGDSNVDYVEVVGNTARSFVGGGDYSFAEVQSFTLGSDTTDIKAADFTGDGVDDLVVVDQAAASAVLFVANGDGTFQGAQTFFTANDIFQAAVGDFNGDLRMDIAFRNEGAANQTVSVMMGNGDGGFAAPVSYAAAAYTAGGMESVDIDRNGALDLLIGAQNVQGVSMLLGNSDVQFDTVISGPPTQVARAPSNVFANNITTRVGGMVAVEQLQKLRKEIKSDLIDLNEILSEIMAARRFALEGVRNAEDMRDRVVQFRDAEALAEALVQGIRRSATDYALAAHSDLDRNLAKDLGL